MRRFLSWALGGLAVGAAARALFRPEAAVAPGPSATPSEAAPIDPARLNPADSLQAAELGAAGTQPEREDQLSDRWHTVAAFARLLLQRLKAHSTTVIAGSVAYYALLAIFPAAIAAISIYGLVADPADLTSLIESLADNLPESTATLIREELTQVVTADEAGLGLVTGLGIAAALWSASAGAKVLITGVNLAYGERETRSYLVVRGLALALTVGMIFGIVIVVSGVAILPRLVDSSLTDLVRWPALIVLAVVGLAALYRIAPSDAPGRNHPIWQGALAAAIVWLAATAVFSVGVSEFGRFSATYGTLAGVVVLLLWFFLSGLIVLLGAEFNAAIEVRRERLATETG